MFSQSYVVILINKGEKTLLQLRHLHIIWLKYMEKALQKKKKNQKPKPTNQKRNPKQMVPPFSDEKVHSGERWKARRDW